MSGITGGSAMHTAWPASSGDAYRLRRLFDHLPALVAYWDADLHNVIANRAYIDWFGMSPEEMEGIHIREVLGEEVFQKNLPYLEAARRGEEQHFERTLVDPNGRIRHSKADYIPEIVDGDVVGFFVLVTDITDQVEAQRELDHAQSVTKVGSWIFYPKSGEAFWSREMYRLIDLDPEDGQPGLGVWSSYIHPEDREEVMRERSTKVAARESYEVDYRLLLPSGEIRYVHSITEITPDDGHGVQRMSGTIQDVSQIHRMTEQLRQANDELANANHLLSDMVAMIGHDIRQPIQSVTGFLEFAVEQWSQAPSEQLQRAVTRALESGRRMNGMVDDILMLMNLDAGSLALRPSDIDIGEVVLAEVAESPGGSEVAVDVRADAVAHVDPFHLRQALANLLSNARRYGAPPIEVIVDQSGDRARISVVDHGEGVPPDFAPRLFDRFSRGTSGRAGSQPGSGFGLYIVRQLVESNGGTIEYSPNEPRGSRFTISLPCRTASA